MAPNVSVQRILLQEIETLSEDLASEVLDFVQFIKDRRAEERFLWQQIEATRVYRQDNPQDVVTLTIDEWLTESADVDLSD